ncbi:hypothetical protein MXL46_04355 [Heyndrickxia sporothermodurans]|uniref:hypothetical protein n=1 Tax=Heyndrickxia TaxID=2837504 RepID=UPI000D33E80C|nr:hypothetical protein [Heyndrickxia sporothermodurans]MEB6548342.1 hypothetical protein [Heyndrickxia sporothermodurans]MED3652833.1 hypothetical protein [Heyndrickxia sporothermodurans]PTY76853.1 hypothetical protein B5V89_16890 [Heyndrickxia sporothermodurans]
MKNEEFKERHHRGDVHKRRDHHMHGRGGAKTFRRGRAIAFLETLNLKRATLKQQLETPELQTINPILVGELKAVETVINEFVQLFELHEFEEMEAENKQVAGKTSLSEESLNNEH